MSNRNPMPPPQGAAGGEIGGMPPPAPPSLEAEESKVQDESLSDVTPQAQVKPANKGIEVVATRAGFFKNVRYNAGDKFMIPSLEKAGSWMKCTDAVAEKQREGLMLQRKRQRAGK